MAKDRVLFPEVVTKQGCLSLLSLSTELAVPAGATRQDKEVKGMHIREEEI